MLTTIYQLMFCFDELGVEDLFFYHQPGEYDVQRMLARRSDSEISKAILLTMKIVDPKDLTVGELQTIYACGKKVGAIELVKHECWQ